MDFQRKIMQRLLNWSQNPHPKPLLLRGARQVGKTSIVNLFGRTHFPSSFVSMNFERRPDLIKIFEKNLEPLRIISELSLALKQEIHAEKSLLFFDEIQECPKAIMALRYFFEELPGFHVIAAGSLLEFTLEHISIPVGRLHMEYMFPLSFSEFLEATGRSMLVKKMPTLEELSKEIDWSISEVVAQEFYQALREYWIVGGMPAVIDAWLKHLSYLDVAEVQDDLIATFLSDMRKYIKRDSQLANASNVFRRVFRFVGQEITYSTLGEGDNGQRTASSLKLLEMAMLVHRVKSTAPQGIPVAAYENEKHFKTILLDIGLGQRMSGFEASSIFKSDDLLTSYEGRLAEQFVGQQLLSESSYNSFCTDLFCWIRPNKSAKAEVDYIIQRHGELIPVEVKSGERGRLKSLRVLLNEYPTLSSAVVVQAISKIKRNESVLHVPLFTIL